MNTDRGNHVDLEGPGRVLVVDDSRSQRAIIESLLSKKGMEVVTAETGAEALARLNDSKPDLVLLDVMLPDLDGFRLCRMIRSNKRFQDLPVIFITALDKREDILAGFKAGGSDYVPKPFRAEELLARVRAHLAVALAHKRQLRQMQLLLEQHDRLQRSALTEGLAHNLNNLVAVLKGNLTWLESELEDPDQRGAVADMLEVTSKLEQIAKALTGVGASQLQGDMPLGRLLTDLCDALEPSLPKGVSLVREFEPDMPHPVPTALESILSALLLNAKEATEQGSITVSAEVSGGQATIRVADTGHGLDEETKAKAFLPFFSTKDTVGAGLGLHSARLTAERLGGTVDLDGAPGRGAVATVRIPLSEAERRKA